MTMILTEKQAKVLAYKVAIRQVANTEPWLEWEDYPNLTESSFLALDREVTETVVGYLRRALRQMEDTWQEDSAYLLELSGV